MTNIGRHLLGRIRSPKDERDFRLENFLGFGYAAPEEAKSAAPSPSDLVASAEAELRLTEVSYKRWAATKYADVTQTHWWKALNYLSQVLPQPTPPPSGDVTWQDPEAVLDQGDYGTCVGNGCAQWGNTLPVDDKWDEKVARAIYYEATILDGSPDDPDAKGGGQQGATVRSGVKALQNRQRLSAYASTASLDTVKAWIDSKGPVIFGSDWLSDMFYPDDQGYITFTGNYEGGHCYLCLGHLASEDAMLFLNSWGTGWAQEGYFKMKSADVEGLLAAQGEAWTAVELA